MQFCYSIFRFNFQEAIMADKTEIPYEPDNSSGIQKLKMEPIDEPDICPEAFVECKLETPDIKTEPLCIENYYSNESYGAKRFKISAPSEWACDQCDYIAASKCSVREHKRAKHIEVRYPCDQCDYAAPTVWYLEQHRAKHQATRYACD